MKLLLKTAAVGLLLAGAAGSSSQAHHSGSMYDPAKLLTISGTVKAFNWINPHISIDVVTDAKPGEPSVMWSVAGSSPGVMSRSGWTKADLKPGDHITIEFNPLRDGGLGGNIKKANLPNGKSLGWTF